VKSTKYLLVLPLALFICLPCMAMRWLGQPQPQPKIPIPESTKLTFTEVARFDIPAANQGVAVDEHFFYAVDNQVITKHDKVTGKEVARWEWAGDPAKNPIIHLDGGTVIDGKLYGAHSNYSEWPMTSSIEVWDVNTMTHIGTHSFGIQFGSCTWVDWYNGSWWVCFANYDAKKAHPDPNDPGSYNVAPGLESTRKSVQAPYGYKRNTLIVQYTPDWQFVEAWTLPPEILMNEHTGDMSTSGGSWGPDGYLYITGHDPSEIHRCKLPEAGSVLVLVDTIPLRKTDSPKTIADVSIRGQGIAWDRSRDIYLYGIIRATSAEKKAGITHKVTVSMLNY
jgi:hypothetical protein